MSNRFDRGIRANDTAAVKANVKSTYAIDWDGAKPPSLEGTKYSRYGARPSGLGSMLDSDIVKRNIEREQQNLGDGFIQMAILDDDKKNKPINIGGRLHYADSKGVFTIIDEKYLEIMKQRETEKREYIESLIQTAIMSDEICATLLGTNEQGLRTILGSGAGREYGVDGDLLAVDARPSAIETYAETSPAYSNAVQKFKIVIKAKMPIVSELTPGKALNEQ